MEKSGCLAKNSKVTVGLPVLGSVDVSRASVQRASLALLVIQNSALILILHHARTVPLPNGHRYFTSTAVLLVEVIKLVLSLSGAAYDLSKRTPSQSVSATAAHLYHDLVASGSTRLIVPAGLYTLQNTLVYVAISNLDAITFQVTYQLKILTTVLFSIALLGRSVTRRQWISLILLTIGVAVVQISEPLSSGTYTLEQLKSSIVSAVQNLDPFSLWSSLESGADASGMSAVRGFVAVLAASLISGFTCVYFEKIMKDSLASVSVLTRNAQLAFFSIFPALFLGVLWQDGAEIAEHGFFVGYTPLVWMTILLQALGGIIVAVCIAYADNVAKNFAASLSIIMSCAIGALFQRPVSLLSTAGTSTVLLAVYLYQTSARAKPEALLPILQIRSMQPRPGHSKS